MPEVVIFECLSYRNRNSLTFWVVWFLLIMSWCDLNLIVNALEKLLKYKTRSFTNLFSKIRLRNGIKYLSCLTVVDGNNNRSIPFFLQGEGGWLTHCIGCSLQKERWNSHKKRSSNRVPPIGILFSSSKLMYGYPADLQMPVYWGQKR